MRKVIFTPKIFIYHQKISNKETQSDSQMQNRDQTNVTILNTKHVNDVSLFNVKRRKTSKIKLYRIQLGFHQTLE